MPIIQESNYQKPKFYFKNGHFSTIYWGRFLKTQIPLYQRHRLELEDGDFVDIDLLEKDSRKAVILCHGLEGASKRTYNNTSAAYFLENGYSVFAWNNRSCSGEMNRLLRMYHHASIEDLHSVVEYVGKKGYSEIYLLGFSMGAAQILNYFSRMETHKNVKGGVAVSVPIQVGDSAEKLKRGFNRVYLKNFLIKIEKKINQKERLFPDALDWTKLKNAKDFDAIDDHFTAPAHGFIDRNDYYTKASPFYSLDSVEKPVLILNAYDDPFLGETTFLKDVAKKDPNIFLEMTKYGGHCAFPMKNAVQSYSEIRALEFFEEINSSAK